MTRKDYVRIADIISAHSFGCRHSAEHREQLAIELAEYLKEENPNGFDERKFIRNCKGDSWT